MTTWGAIGMFELVVVTIIDSVIKIKILFFISKSEKIFLIYIK